MYRSYRNERLNDINRALVGWITRTGKGIEGEARTKVPGATGLLRKSINFTLLNNKPGTDPIGAVAIGEKYGKFVEGYPVATKRHFMPFDKYPAFEAWARRKGFDTSRGGLLVWGYATNFFKNAINAIKAKAMADLRSLRLGGSL